MARRIMNPDRFDKDIPRNWEDLAEEMEGYTSSLAESASKLEWLNNNKKLSDKVGIHHYMYTPDLVNIGNGTDTTTLDRIKVAGFKYVRYMINWSRVEGTAGVYSFTDYDNYLNKIIAKGLIPVIYIAGSPSSNLAYDYATSISKFPDFVAVVADRYKNKGVIWEIFNEPNLVWFNTNTWSTMTEQDAHDFAGMAISTAQKIRTSDPDAYIIAPALSAGNDYATENDFSYVWAKYMEYLFQDGLLDYIDAISIHPYRINSVPETYLDVHHYQVTSLIKKYTKRHVPVVITEFGYTTAANRTPTTTDDATQAKYMPRAILTFDMVGIPLIGLFAWKDAGTDANDIESNFGIIQNDNVDKASLTSIQNLMSALNGYTFAERLNSAKDDYILKYVDDGMNVKYVYWTTVSSHSIRIEGTNFTATDTVQFYASAKKYSKPLIVNDQEDKSTKELLKTYGLGTVTKRLRYTDDANNVKRNEIAYAYGWVPNTPINATNTGNNLIETKGINTTSDENLQLAYDPVSADMFIRGKSGGVWTKWWKFLKEGLSSLVAQATNTKTTFTQTDGGTGNDAFMSVDPVPKVNTANAIFRFFRNTNTSGNVEVQILTGDGTSTINHDFKGKGDSYVSANNGKFGVGVVNPSEKLDVAGNAKAYTFRITQQTAAASAPNGSFFEDTDGKAKYKNLAGVVTDLTL